MAITTNQHPFSVSVVGESTNETYKGDFVTTRILSQRQLLLSDRLFREYLGGENPMHAADWAKDRAQTLADINSALVQVPRFWRDASMGLDLLDSNILSEVWKEVQRVQREAQDAIKARSEKDAAKLKDLVENRPVTEEYVSPRLAVEAPK